MPLKIGKTEKYMLQTIEERGAMLMHLIDPDKIYNEQAVKSAKIAEENDADMILIGGTIGAQGTVLDETVKMIKENTSLPVLLFPGNISGVTKYADATYFLQMLNSRDVYWISTAQIQGAPLLAKLGLEAIPTSYLVVEPGRAVGWIGNANLIPRDRADLAAACALAGKYIGAHVVLLESGSGAPEPAPIPMLQAVAKACGDDAIPILAGGVRTADQATDVVKAGFKGIHVGTAFEDLEGAAKKIKSLAQATHKQGKKRV